MKRIIALFLLLATAVSLCACGGTAAQTQAPQSAQAEPTEAPEPEINWEEIYNEAAQLYYKESNFSAAFEAIKDAEEADYAPVLRLLGTCCLSGNGTEKDEEKGLALIEKAAELGDVLALYLVGNAYQNGLGTEADFEKAKEFYTQFMQSAESAAENDTPEQGNILYSMGYSYSKGIGAEFDMNKALEVFQKAVETGKLSADTKYSIALAVEKADIKTATTLYREVFPVFEERAKNGETKAQGRIGNYYYYGDGITPKNLQKAFDWYSKAAEQGDVNSLLRLSIMYGRGESVDTDINKAEELIQKAIEIGVDSTSMVNVGYIYSNILDDQEKATEWYLKAAEMGERIAMQNMGARYESGKGIAQDYQKAMEWYLKAAEAGDDNAMLAIGGLYYFGHGVEQDYVECAYWNLKASELGNKTAKDNLKVKEIADALPEARKRVG